MAQTDLSGPLVVAGAVQSGGLVSGATIQGREVIALAAGDGAIAIAPGVVAITKATAAALTLAAPTAAQDGTLIHIVSTTAAAHTVTQTTPGFNGAGASGDVATYGAAIGNSMTIVAYNGVWLVLNLTGVTLA